MGHKKLVFNGKSSEELGVVIQTTPVYNYPEKDVTSTHVPGRNGDLIIDTGSYKNVSRSYSLALEYPKDTTFVDNAQELMQWLKTAVGYSRLEDDYDPEVYRMARYSASGSLSDIYEEATTLTVQFECKPQRYLKIGELSSKISVPTGSISNPTAYESLPKITFTNLPDDAGNIMVTFSNGEYSNIVTINSLISDSVVIDSNTQEVYDPTTGKSLSSMVNMNENEFPLLKAGETTIKTQLFSDTITEIPTYKNILENNQDVLEVKYSQYDTILETKQSKIVVPSFNARKVSLEESYYARAYSAYCLEKAATYTFKSINSLISEQAYSITFIAGEDDPSTLVDWISTEYANDKYAYKFKLEEGGWIYITSPSLNASKKWTYYTKDSVLLSEVSANTQCTIQYIKTTSVTDKTPNINYTDIPSWLKISFSYSTTIDSISYVTNAEGTSWYYTQKTGLLSKAKWINVEKGYILDTLKWSSWKKAFISYEGLSASTTSTYTYRYLSGLPQYEDVWDEITDSNGNKKKTLTSKVRFVVTGSITDPVFKISEGNAGWYRCNDSSSNPAYTDWVYRNPGDTMPSGFNSDSTEANNIYYISDQSSITYAKVSSWPEWLDPTPETDENIDTILNAKSIKLKVLKDGYYRYTYAYTDSSGSEQTGTTDQIQLTAGSYLTFDNNTSGTKGFAPDASKTIYYIETLPEDHSSEFNLTFNGGFAKDNIPEWCIFVWFPIVTEDDPDPKPKEWDHITKTWIESSRKPTPEESATTATYEIIARSKGTYRLDENVEWVAHESEDFISSSKYSDDTKVRYLVSTPHYPDNDYFTDNISINSTGNFTAVTIKAKKDGYYRLSTNTSWTYYNVNDDIVVHDTEESNSLLYMTPIDLTYDINIEIIPNWWML